MIPYGNVHMVTIQASRAIMLALQLGVVLFHFLSALFALLLWGVQVHLRQHMRLEVHV